MYTPLTYDAIAGPGPQVSPPTQAGGLRPPEHRQMDAAALDDRGLLLPHYRTFQSLYNLTSKVYSYRWDEAVRSGGFKDSAAMKCDQNFRALLQERLTPLGLWDWEVQADPDPLNPKDPYSEDKAKVSRMLTAECKATPNLLQFRKHLGWTLWYGRVGNQLVYARRPDRGLSWNPFVCDFWTPVDGDKLQYSFDDAGPGHWCVYLNSGSTGRYPGETTVTDRTTALRLRRPDYRTRFVIAANEIEDAPFEDYVGAGRAYGVGIRDWVFWSWDLQKEMLGWMVSLMEKAGSLGILVFKYPAGNAAAKAKAEENARDINNRNALVVPVQEGTRAEQYGVEAVTTPTEGLRFMQSIVFDEFKKGYERLIVGQSLSAGTEGSGLGGSGVADMHEATKFTLLRNDAVNQGECLTEDFVRVLKQLNHADAPGVYRWTYLLPDPKAKDKLDAISKAASLPGRKLEYRADDVRKLVGLGKPEEGDETVGGDDPQQMGPGAPGGVGAAGGGPQPGQPGGSAVLAAALAQAAHDGDQQAIDRLTELAGDPAGLDGLLDDLTHDEAGADARQPAPAADAPPGRYAAGRGTVAYAWSEGSTRNGHVKAVGSAEHAGQTLYGEKAEAALRGRKKGAGDEPGGPTRRTAVDPAGGPPTAPESPTGLKALAVKLLSHVRRQPPPPGDAGTPPGDPAGAGKAGTGAANTSGGQNTPDPSGTAPRPGSTAKERLARTPVVKSTTLGGGVNETRLIELEDGGKGVFKPAAGESEGLRLGVPDGTYYRREAAVSAVADALGFGDLVPPTTVRDVGGETGSVQEFVPGGTVAKKVGSIRNQKARYDGDEDAARTATFDYLTGHSDRHTENWMLAATPENPAGKLVLIDNGLSLPTAYHEEDYFNFHFYEHVKAKKLAVPADAADLPAKWPAAEAELRAAGIEDEAIRLTRERLGAVAAHAGKPIADLPAFWSDGGKHPMKMFVK